MREVKKKERQKPRRMKKERVKRKREEGKEEDETGAVKRRCEGVVSVEALGFFCQGRDLESCGNLSWEDLLLKHEGLSDREPYPCAHVRVVLDATDVLVSPSSVVTESCDGFSCCSGRCCTVVFFLSSKSVHIVVQVRKKR